MEQDKIAALASIRNQLGKKITTGTEWMRVQESREDWQDGQNGQNGQEREWPTLTMLEKKIQKQEAAPFLKGTELSLGRGIPRGQLTEVIESVAQRSVVQRGVVQRSVVQRGVVQRGAGLVMAAILAQARLARQYVMLCDVGSGFSVKSFPEQDLESLLWVGCASASEAVEALDIASRDENFSLFLLDFRNCEPNEWRSVRPQQWYRLLGQMRQRSSAAVVFAETPVSSTSKQKWVVRSSLSCQDLYRERAHLWEEIQLSPAAGEGRQERREVDYRQKVG